jgi:hypothetical protein
MLDPTNLNFTVNPGQAFVKTITRTECQELLDAGKTQHTILLTCCIILIGICVWMLIKDREVKQK